jgi:hypothetical protein
MSVSQVYKVNPLLAESIPAGSEHGGERANDNTANYDTEGDGA